MDRQSWKLTVEHLDGRESYETGSVVLKENVLEVHSEIAVDYGDDPTLIVAYPLANIRRFAMIVNNGHTYEPKQIYDPSEQNQTQDTQIFDKVEEE